MADGGWFDWAAGIGDWFTGGGETFDVGDADFGYTGDAGGGGYDFGAIELPDYGGWDVMADLPFASGGGGFQFDTTTGQIIQPSGEPFSFGQDFTRYTGGAEQPGDYVAAPGAPGGTVQSGTPFLESLNRFMGSNVGRAAGAAGVGLLGLGAQRLFAGETPDLRLPGYTPSPVTQAGQAAVLRALQGGAGPALTEALTLGTAGQRDVAGQIAARVGRETAAETAAAPYEDLTRRASLDQVLALMQPGGEQAIVDPIEAAIRKELLGVLGGETSGISPTTQRRQQQEEQVQRAELYRRLGPDYELTTPGIQALQEMRRRFNEEQYTERQATIARLSPLEQSRMQFSTTAPVNLQAGRESTRRAALTDAERLSRFGKYGVPENLTSLSQIVPVQTLLGGDPERAGQINTQLQTQQALTAFGAQTQRQRDLAQGIGSMAGTVAGAVGSRPSQLSSYYDRILANSPNASVYGYA